ncbi:MAG: ABC transporter ATP-binding protein [Clostridiales bacterium]|nr:ABC transporter ATP-binding protein [Clostridiales bacterium]
MVDNMINVTNIQKKYGKHEVLKNISFEAVKGECIGFVGANGCGKSTLLGILAGTLKPNGGNISIHNSTIGYVPQDNPLLSGLSVKDNLRFWYCDSGKNLKDELTSGIPAKFGLTKYAKFPVEKLSGGMKKRLSIACALANDPSILVLDEPGASLDMLSKTDIMDYLKDYLSRENVVLIASHEEIELSLCNRIYLIESGTLSEISTSFIKNELIERMRNHD